MTQHIVVLDDDNALRQLYGLYLTRGRFDVTLVELVEDLFKVLATKPVDLLMIDVNLNQKLNGIDVIQKIRQDNRYHNLEILIVSSFPNRYPQLDDLNVAGTLTKPIHYMQLMQTLKTVLNVSFPTLI